jgi:hypothetical protein
MEFDYTIEDSIWVSEDDLNEMAEQVKSGRPAEMVVDEYIACLDDGDYYNSSAYDYKIIAEVRKRAREL